jgi:hypothetical protein
MTACSILEPVTPPPSPLSHLESAVVPLEALTQAGIPHVGVAEQHGDLAQERLSSPHTQGLLVIPRLVIIVHLGLQACLCDVDWIEDERGG